MVRRVHQSVPCAYRYMIHDHRPHIRYPDNAVYHGFNYKEVRTCNRQMFKFMRESVESYQEEIHSKGC